MFIPDEESDASFGTAYIPIGATVPSVRQQIRAYGGDRIVFECLVTIETIRVISDETIHRVLVVIGETVASGCFDSPLAVLLAEFDLLWVEDLIATSGLKTRRGNYMMTVLLPYCEVVGGLAERQASEIISLVDA